MKTAVIMKGTTLKKVFSEIVVIFVLVSANVIHRDSEHLNLLWIGRSLKVLIIK